MEKMKKENLKKLARTAILTNFIKKKNAEWNHDDWLELCEKISTKYSPIDFDLVGLLLEEKKEKFLQKC